MKEVREVTCSNCGTKIPLHTAKIILNGYNRNFDWVVLRIHELEDKVLDLIEENEKLTGRLKCGKK
jgi:hypothetical protein